MEYAVVGGAAAVGQGLVGNVHAVAAILLQAGFPAHAGIPLAGHAGYLPGGAHGEGVVVLYINFFLVGETLAGILPQAFFLVEAVASHGKAGAAEVGVVVADNLQRTGVPFARGENVGARPLKHRDEEGNDIALGVEVFGGGPVRRTLPAPDSGSVVEEAPVALPEGYMAAVKASVVSASAKPLDEGSAGLCVHFELVGAGLPVPAYRGLGQLFQIHALAPYTSQGVVADFFRPQLLKQAAEPSDVLPAPGIVPQFLGEVEVQDGPSLHCLVELKARAHAEMLFRKYGDRIHPGFEGLENGFLGIRGKAQQQ